MSKRILLVDDDQDFVASVSEWLKANDFEVVVALDGASGIEKARQLKPDLMILDVMMATDTEGIEVSRKIAEIAELRTMPVIVLTGIRKAKNLPFGLSPDANWLPVKIVMEKPVPPETLLKEIRKLLA